jgi:hypothetical protein
MNNNPKSRRSVFSSKTGQAEQILPVIMGTRSAAPIGRARLGGEAYGNKTATDELSSSPDDSDNAIRLLFGIGKSR